MAAGCSWARGSLSFIWRRYPLIVLFRMRCQGKMCFALLCAVMLHSSVAAPVQDDFTIGNAYVNIQFDGSTGNLVNMEDKLQSTSVVDADLSPGSPPPPSVDLWGLSLVGAGGELAVTGRGTVAAGLSRDAGSQVLSIVWSGVGVAASQGNGTQDVALLDVRLSVALPDDSAVSAWQLGLTVREIYSPAASIGVWEASINVPAGIADAEDGELFYPRGFGVTYSNPRASARPSLSSTYPSGSASMQYMSTGRRSLASGLFMAAMDPVGEAKNMDYAAPSSEAASYLRIKIFPEGAGVPIPVGGSWAAPFAVSVGAISGIDAAAGRPMWVEGALMYKRWALQSARWTRDGPLAARPKEFPAWFTDNSVWINSHWQCHDIFNAVRDVIYVYTPLYIRVVIVVFVDWGRPAFRPAVCDRDRRPVGRAVAESALVRVAAGPGPLRGSEVQVRHALSGLFSGPN